MDLTPDKFEVLSDESIELIDKIYDKKAAIEVFEKFLKIMDISKTSHERNMLMIQEKELSKIIEMLKNNIKAGVSKDFAHTICSCCPSNKQSYSSQFLKVLTVPINKGLSI